MLSAAKTLISRPSGAALGVSAKNSIPVFGRNLSSAAAVAAEVPPVHVQDVPAMPACDFQPGKYTGPSYEEVLKIRRENMNPALFTYYKEPLLIHQGHMQWLWDHKGRRYLDLFGGIVTVSVGHCHPKINKAVQEQQSRLWHTTNIYLHPKVHEYASRLTATLPATLNTVYFVNSGSEANDLALHMARMHTGNHDAITLRNGYHGANMSTTALTAVGTWRYPGANIGSLGVHHATCPDPYTGIWGGARCRALHFNTFGGNPIASTVGIAVLDAIKDDKLQENCKVVGTHFLNELAKLRDESPVVGDVRGKGLMIGVELVSSKENRTPLDNEKVLKIWEAMREYGVLVGKGGLNGNVLRIKPPMCITKEDADFCVAVLRKALERV